MAVKPNADVNRGEKEYRTVSILYKYHISHEVYVKSSPNGYVCRSFISIIFPK